MSRLYAFKKILKHQYPIIIDSFRAEDLSTSKENVVLNLFTNLGDQVIFTTTLKTEELGKYDNYEGINHIDYKNHAPSKMLSKEYLGAFMEILSELSISM